MITEIYDWKGFEWQPSASPSRNMAYTRLVLTEVQETQEKTRTYQMHWDGSGPSKPVSSKPLFTYKSLETAFQIVDTA